MNNVNFASYADDSIYVIEDGEIPIIEFLKETSDKLFCWFANNHMKAIPDKCHLKHLLHALSGLTPYMDVLKRLM